jgi:hypothetical protein
VVAFGILLVVAAVAAYAFRNTGCFPASDELKAARYAECLRDGRDVGLAALVALAVGAVLVVIGAIRLTHQRR